MAGLAVALSTWFAVGPAAGLAFGLIAGLVAGHGPQIQQSGTPNVVRLRWSSGSLAVALGAGSVSGLAAGLAFGRVTGLTFGLVAGLMAGLRPRFEQSDTPSAWLRWSSGSLAVALGAGSVSGLAAGSVGGPIVGLAFGLMAALVAGLRPRFEQSDTPSAWLRWSTGSLAFGLVAGALAGLVAALIAGLMAAPESRIAVGLAFGLAAGLTGGLAGGLTTQRPDLTDTVGPATLLALDRRTLLTFGLVRGLGGGLTGTLMGGLSFGLAFGLTSWLSFGLTGGLTGAAWTNFAMARAYLAARRQTPWNLMTFLKDAHEHRGVLRQVGAAYQFRHIDLQRHLVQQPSPPAPDDVDSAP